MRTPASIVPALFVILGIVLPIGILATVYIVSLKVTAIAGIIVIIITLICMNRGQVIEGKKKIYYFFFLICEMSMSITYVRYYSS